MRLSIRWRSLRNKIIAWSFIPTTIILVAVALVTFYAYQQVTEDLVITRNRQLARLSAGQLLTELSQYSDTLSTLARTSDIYRTDPPKQRDALARASNRLVIFDAGTILLNNRGIVVAAEPARPDALGQDWSNRPYFRQLFRSRGPVYSDILKDGPDEAEVVVVAVPITGEQGEFQGALAGLFRIRATAVSSFYGSIVKLRVGEGGNVSLVDSQGRLIYHSRHDYIGTDVSAQPAAGEVLAGKVGAIRTTDIEGRDVVASFAPVPGTPWGLVAQESWDTLMGPSQSYARFLLLLLGLGIVVPIVVVSIGVRRITRPITELIGAAKAVAGGNFGQMISSPSGDELEQLAEQFNRMSAQLAESYAELERRVASRTRELATLNSIASVANRSLDLEETLHDALDKALELMGFDAGAAYRLDEETQTLRLMAHRGLSEEYVRQATEVSATSGWFGRVAVEERPVVVEATPYSGDGLGGLLEVEGLRQVACVPLTAKGKLLGVMSLAAQTPRLISPEERSLLASVGQQIGMAVENARLYEHAEESAAAAERNRLARDLHDAVTQTLFSASLIAEVLPRLWERNPEEGRRRIEELRQLTRGALAEMRTLLLELRPAAMVEAELGNLLRQLAEATTGRARVPVAVTVEGDAPLPSEVRVALYRIAQEALNNVAKHSGATQATVTLLCQGGEVELCVGDNGRGFDVSSVTSDHLGLGIMAERAESIGARIETESQIGRGTRVTVTWTDPRAAVAD